MYVFIQIIDIIRIPNAASVYFVGVNRELFYNMTTTCIYWLRSYCKFCFKFAFSMWNSEFIRWQNCNLNKRIVGLKDSKGQ